MNDYQNDLNFFKGLMNGIALSIPLWIWIIWFVSLVI